jgi:MYXO-CTERM domain-containing protein
MRTAPAAVLTLLVLATSAWAGDAENPEITDAANDAGAGAAFGDITAGWFNDTVTDVSITLQIAQMPAPVPNSGYFVVADVGAGENTTYGWGAIVDQSGAVQYFFSHWDRELGPTDFNAGQGELQTGQPATLTSLLPRAFANNVTAGAMLTQVQAGTGELTPVNAVPAPLPLPGQLFFVQTDDATGTDYMVVTGAARPAPPSATHPGNGTGIGGNGPAPLGNGTDGSGTNTTGPPPSEPARTPGFEPIALAAAAVALGLARRRRA